MPEFQFLNNALASFLQTIQNIWAPIFQMGGIDILLTIGGIALAVYSLNLLATQDVAGFILGIMYTFIALAILHEVFLKSEYLATSILNMFLAWAQEVSGMSPNVLTPSGIMETGLQLAGIFWTAGGHASWFWSPISAVEIIICTIAVVIAFGLAAIIYLLALVEVWALIIAASVLLAFAGLPWTWNMFPGWMLSVFSSCIKIFFLLCVLAIGLAEANGWATAMAAVSGTIMDNLSLMMQVTVESMLFIGVVYYIPTLMSRMVIGALGPVMGAGEAMLGGLAASFAANAGGAALSAPRAAGNATLASGKTLATVSKMLLR